MAPGHRSGHGERVGWDMTNERPTPNLLLPVYDPATSDADAVDILAIPLNLDVLDRMGTAQAEAAEMMERNPNLEGLAYRFSETRWYVGIDQHGSWVPDVFGGDPVWGERFKDEDHVPVAVRDVAEAQKPAFVDRSLFDDWERAGSNDAHLEVERGHIADQRLLGHFRVGPGLVASRVYSDPVRRAHVAWGRLYWAAESERPERFGELVRLDPALALDVIEHGMVVHGADPASVLSVRSSLAPADLQPLLEHSNGAVRQRAITLVGATGPDRGDTQNGRMR